MARLFDVVGKIGEGTYGVVYLARSRAPQPCLLAVKTFKPGKVLAQDRRVVSLSVASVCFCSLARADIRADRCLPLLAQRCAG